MLCENCGQRPASVHHTVILNGAKRETHLCEVCAREKSEIVSGFSFPNLSIQQLLSSFLGQVPFGSEVAPPLRAEPVCRSCGFTYSEFANNGLLGCSDCYDQFEPHLEPLIKRIHGTSQHTGKVPKRTGGAQRKRREAEQLRSQLTAAISQERFEEAARLRDRIKAIEGELLAGGEGHAVE